MIRRACFARVNHIASYLPLEGLEQENELTQPYGDAGSTRSALPQTARLKMLHKLSSTRRA
jgi:hypothetical protein